MRSVMRLVLGILDVRAPCHDLHELVILEIVVIVGVKRSECEVDGLVGNVQMHYSFDHVLESGLVELSVVARVELDGQANVLNML